MLSASAPTAAAVSPPPSSPLPALTPQTLPPFPLMWRRLPARRLASALLSSFPVTRAAAPRAPPLERRLLPATSSLLPPPRFPSLQQEPRSFASSAAAEAVSLEEAEELHHALENFRVQPNQNQPPPPVEEQQASGRDHRSRHRRNRRGQQAQVAAAEHGMTYHKYASLRRRQIRGGAAGHGRNRVEEGQHGEHERTRRTHRRLRARRSLQMTIRSDSIALLATALTKKSEPGQNHRSRQTLASPTNN